MNRLMDLEHSTKYNRNSNTARVSMQILTEDYNPVRTISGKSSWVNRTWESYEYASALGDALRKAGASPANISYVQDPKKVHNIEGAFKYLQENLELQVPYHKDQFVSYK